MVIETDHREEYRNETRMDASSTLAGSTFKYKIRKIFLDLDSFYRKAERPVEAANAAALLRRVAPGLPIFFGAIAKLVRQRTANPLSLVRIQVAPLGL